MKTRTVLGAALTAAIVFASTAHGEADFRKRASDDVLTADDMVADVKAEIEFGRDVAARILGRYPLAGDKALTHYVNLVGQAVALHAGRSDIDYHFAVLDTNAINAFAAPGGYIFVTRGALEAMEDESELAGVLAHEVAHVTRKHIVRELNIKGTEASPEAGMARFLGGAGDSLGIAFKQAVDKAVELLFVDGLKREDEFEADRVGTLIVANTGYDAQALRRYLDRISDEEGDRVSVLHATHPPFDDRLSALGTLIREERLTMLDGPRVAARFRANMK